MTAIAERSPGRPVTTPEVTMAAALNQALADALREDETVLVFGEDVGTLGGVFRVTDGLAAEFGERRVFDTPLAESAIVGTAIGMAMNGLRPVVEMQFDAFAYPAFEQIISHLAKFRNRTRGRVALPVVIRIPYGGGIGGVEHHCDSSEAYYGTVGTALEAAEAAAEEDRSVEVIDLRSLSPFDDETVTASVRRTGRAIVVHEASRFCGYGAEVAARLSEQCFHYLEAPVLRVAGFDIPYPPPHLEEYHLPSVDRILDAVDRLQWQETRPAVKAGG